jgi:hypothetical protein
MATGISIESDVRGLQRLASAGPNALDTALAIVTEELVNDIKLLMTKSPATGRAYRRGGRSHVASSSPNAPRPDMGALLGSIRLRKRGRLSYEIQDGVEYGIMMEIGTEDIEPRPFMRPAFEEYRLNKFSAIIKQQLGI